MGPLDDGVIGGTTFARKAHLYSQREQPQMQPCGKRRRCGVIIEDRAMIQRQRFRQTIRQERSALGQLVVWQSWIGRFQAGITFSLEATDHIDQVNQTDLAHPFYSHDALSIHLPFLMWSAR